MLTQNIKDISNSSVNYSNSKYPQYVFIFQNYLQKNIYNAAAKVISMVFSQNSPVQVCDGASWLNAASVTSYVGTGDPGLLVK